MTISLPRWLAVLLFIWIALANVNTALELYDRLSAGELFKSE